jgi:hypothetical protein
MATTNEDAAILASARLEDGRMLVVRHLPDRGTIEIGFWGKDAGAVVLQPPALEIAAEAAELDALAGLCGRALAATEGGEGAELAAAGPFADGARLTVLGSGDGVMLARPPEDDNRLPLSREALQALAGLLPAARQRAEHLGLGLPQQQAPATERPA